MALNLIDLAKDYLTPDTISRMAGLVGESPAATQKALGAIVPSLAGIACNQASTPGGATKLMNLVTTSGQDSVLLNNFTSALSGGSTTDGLLIPHASQLLGTAQTSPSLPTTPRTEGPGTAAPS